jgi:hypothetical protein
VEVAIMAENGFKLKLNTIIKGYGNRLPHCISSGDIPAFKITLSLPYKSTNSVTRVSDWRKAVSTLIDRIISKGGKNHGCFF